jgi:hypothetical protein
MKSIFTMGTFGAPRERFWMGQEPAITVSSSQRDEMVRKLDAAIDKVQAQQAWAKNHPNLQQDLGADFETYQTQAHNLDALATNATIAYQKFASPDSAVWQTVSAQEWNDAETWTMFAGYIYDIISRHPTGGVKPIPGKPAGPIAPATPAPSGVSPLLVGAGVLAVGLVAIAVLT